MTYKKNNDYFLGKKISQRIVANARFILRKSLVYFILCNLLIISDLQGFSPLLDTYRNNWEKATLTRFYQTKKNPKPREVRGNFNTLLLIS